MRHEAQIRMCEGMLVSYTHITPRDDCPIRKVMRTPEVQHTAGRTDIQLCTNLCTLDGRLEIGENAQFSSHASWEMLG